MGSGLKDNFQTVRQISCKLYVELHVELVRCDNSFSILGQWPPSWERMENYLGVKCQGACPPLLDGLVEGKRVYKERMYR